MNILIPGVNIIEGREYRYISDDGNDFFMGTRKKHGLFYKITNFFNPCIAKFGGVITENCRLWLPNGELFHGVSYKGDIEGFRYEIEQSAKELKLFSAKIEDGNFIISDGRKYLLSDCKVEFYKTFAGR